MIIDFHTHVFPDDLAAKALNTLIVNNVPYVPVGDGTIPGLLRNMDAWNIDVCVIQPVITKQSQLRTINEWAASVQSGRLVSFGGIYPHTDDYKRDIDYVVSLGLKGLKFHAEYQDFFVDDERMLRIYDYALSRGLILLHHGGFDPSFPPPFHSSPERFARVAEAMRGGVIVVAHLGGHRQWDEAERYLAGAGLYLDTSMGFEYFPHDLFLRIVEKHGADKILFGSDAPWSSAGDELRRLRAQPLSAEEVSAIEGGNAARILGIGN